MENTQTLYYAALLNLLSQTKSFCDAFISAKAAAEAYDPDQNQQEADAMAEKTSQKIAEMLSQQMAVIPGMRHIFENVARSFQSPSLL